MKFAQLSLVATIALALLSSCGPGTEDATKAKEIEDSQRNRQAFGQSPGGGFPRTWPPVVHPLLFAL